MGLDLLGDAVSKLGRPAELALVNVGRWVAYRTVLSQWHSDLPQIVDYSNSVDASTKIKNSFDASTKILNSFAV